MGADPAAIPMDRTALAAWRAAGETVSWRGHRIFLRRHDRSDAPRLVLIHGFPTAGFDWARLWPALAARAALIAPDMLGFGFSAKPRAHRYSLFEQADLVTDLVREAGWADGAPVHVLAHDYGDTVAQELLVRARVGELPFRLASVVFLNGGMFFSAIRLSPMQIRLRDPVGRLLQHLITRGRFRRQFAAIFGAAHRPDRAELDAFFDLVTAGGGRGVLHALSRYLHERAAHEERWSRAVAEAPVPIALIYGPEDPISGESIARRFRELAPDAPVVPLAGVGHYPQVEAPAAVLEAFLALHRRWGGGLADETRAGAP
ncbi:MAG: epoxide hydrolase [Rhodothalassiaceae bacterium]|nr:MAG: epoxide hydrolase [Rhodothalassiaceae bacterium]